MTTRELLSHRAVMVMGLEIGEDERKTTALIQRLVDLELKRLEWEQKAFEVQTGEPY